MLPVATVARFARPGSLPASMTYPVGEPPVAGGDHVSVIDDPGADPVRPIGTPGGVSGLAKVLVSKISALDRYVDTDAEPPATRTPPLGRSVAV